MHESQWAQLAYLAAAVLFIVGIKGMTHPRTAVRGNALSAIGMLVAVVVTLIAADFSWWVVITGLLIGSVAGLVLAMRVQMTQMPEMVALLNGFGGAASVFVAWIEILRLDGVFSTDAAEHTAHVVRDEGFYQSMIAGGLTGLIGAVTLFGSLVAFGKLSEMKMFKKDISIPGGTMINAVLLVACLSLVALCAIFPTLAATWYLLIVLLASVLGLLVTVRIGGADMPVVISLMNSYSGLAAAMAGFVVDNTVLIVTGGLVGASGIILTAIMCKAMNRSLANVLFGGIDASGVTATADEVYGGKVKSTGPDDIAMILDGAQRVSIIPGYGMAVAQAQFATRDLYQLLQERGVDVSFAIHPVAGRMPGHMNVLLAEVDIPYEKLLEMDQANSQFEQTDVAIIIGANDVVNPDARNNPNSPIAGMPILNVDKARTVVVIKRSLSPGFAGIPNPLFALDNTLMYFADGKKAVLDLVKAMQES